MKKTKEQLENELKEALVLGMESQKAHDNSLEQINPTYSCHAFSYSTHTWNNLDIGAGNIPASLTSSILLHRDKVAFLSAIVLNQYLTSGQQIC